jgi:ABC-type phosphate transport system substrate-binding protein
MEQQHWKSGDRIEVVLQASGSEKDTIVQSKVMGLRASELQAFWLGKTFRGEITTAPKTLASDVSVKQLVSGNPRAIGYVDSLLLDGSVKALKIDGKSPGEPGYALARAGGH